MNGVLSIISCPKTIWTGVVCNVIWYVLRTVKAVADNIPD